MNKSFWLILGGVFIGLAALFLLSGGKADDVNTGEFAFTDPILGVQSFDHQVGGGDDAKYTIIEYGDFQCPGCAALFPVLEQVKSEYSDDVRVIYRNNPLVDIHPQAMAAHRAAEAAGKQGMFWPMHDKLFSDQQRWSGANDAITVFEGYAAQFGLDMDQFKEDVGSDSVFSKINSDLDSGQQVGVASTPTIFVNGQKLEPNPRNLDEFKQALESLDESNNQ